MSARRTGRLIRVGAVCGLLLIGPSALAQAQTIRAETGSIAIGGNVSGSNVISAWRQSNCRP
jgi:hypothetical protein